MLLPTCTGRFDCAIERNISGIKSTTSLFADYNGFKIMRKWIQIIRLREKKSVFQFPCRKQDLYVGDAVQFLDTEEGDFGVLRFDSHLLSEFVSLLFLVLPNFFSVRISTMDDQSSRFWFSFHCCILLLINNALW